MFDLTFHIILDDFKVYLDNYRSRSRFPWLSKLLIWGIVLFNVVIFLNDIVSAYNGNGHWMAAFPNAAIVILFLASIYLFTPWVRKRIFERTGLGKGEIHFIADGDKIAAHQLGLVTEAQWGALESISSTETVLFIWMNSRQAFFVPKNAFATPDEAEKFYQFAKHKIETSSMDAE